MLYLFNLLASLYSSQAIFYSVIFGLPLLGLLFLIHKIFNVNVGRTEKSPPCYPSRTTFGSSEFFVNPLDFVRQAQHKLGSPIFSTWMAGMQLTFVRGEKNVAALTTCKNDVASFPLGYRYFLLPTFGNHILTERTAGSQIELLNRYLVKTYLDSYILPTQKLVQSLMSKHLSGDSHRQPGPKGVIDLRALLMEISFSAGARNFLGSDFLSALEKYDYSKIFGGFEMGARFLLQFIPGTNFLLEQINKVRPFDDFEKIVHSMSSGRVIDKPKNVFEDLIKTSHDPNGPTLGKFSVLVNLVKLFVFGTGFNGYNALTFFFRDVLPKKELCQRLITEQLELDKKYGPDFSLNKAFEMKLLNETLAADMFSNTFPFLLRYSKQEIPIGDIIIPKGHIVAYSPQLEHEDQSSISAEGTVIPASAKINHGFGINQHPCPAKTYVLITLRIILSEFLKSYRYTIKEAKPSVNNRLVTFPTQPPLIVEYERI